MKDNLKLETTFSIAVFNATVDKMTKEQAIQTCKQLYLFNIHQKQAFDTLLQKHWGL